jgi:hypothetical protein
MDDIAFLPTNGEFYRGGIWQRKDDEPTEHPEDPATTGDVEAVEKENERFAKGETPAPTDTAKDTSAKDKDADDS